MLRNLDKDAKLKSSKTQKLEFQCPPPKRELDEEYLNV